MIKIDPDLNPLEVMIVTEHLADQGITDYTLCKGNNCIWAYWRMINAYYIFSDGKLVDIHYD